MTVKKFDKLVRDRIPEIIESNGKSCVTEVASKEVYLKKLIDKLQEEVEEFVENPCLEELADILEVVYTIEHATDWGSLILAQLDKRCERGGFKKRLILKEVSE
jgi:predicted house-cleaning noncanonical NTP pyrophosphatase (MazG superfamily)